MPLPSPAREPSSCIARSTLAVALAAISLVRGGASPAAANANAATPSPYRVFVADWKISAIGDAHTGAGLNTNYYYSWNGHDLKYAAGDRSGNDSFDWEWVVTGVNASGTVIGTESETLPASTSGIGSSTQQQALIMVPGPLAGLHGSGSGGLGGASAIDDAGTIAGGGGVVASGSIRRFSRFVAPGGFDANVTADAIDALGHVAGTTTVTKIFGNPIAPGPVHVYLARGPSAPQLDLGVVPHCPGVDVRGIDDADHIVGNCDDGKHPAHAWLWDGHAFTSLPPLAGDRADSASGITASGLVAGTSLAGSRQRAVVWRGLRPVPVASLAPATPGLTLTSIVCVSPDGWLLASAASHGKSVSAVVAPAGQDAPASALARGPSFPSPSPEPTDAPQATAAPNAAAPSPTPEPTSMYTQSPGRSTVVSDLPAPVSPLWSKPAIGLYADETRTYFQSPTSFGRLSASGRALWTRAYAGSLTVSDAGGLLLAVDDKHVSVVDPAAGALRWSRPKGDVVFNDGTSVTIGTDVRTNDVTTAMRVRRYALGSGAVLGMLTMEPDCLTQLTSTAVGCIGPSGTEDVALTGIDVATGRASWTLPGMLQRAAPIADFGDAAYFTENQLLIAIHPAARTYDAVEYPIEGDQTPDISIDGGYVFVSDEYWVSRYLRDRDPAKQHPIRFDRVGADTILPISDGRTVMVSSGGLTSVRIAADGTRITTTYPRVGGKDATVRVAGSHAFVGTERDLTVVDLAAEKVVARAAIACTLQGAGITGTTAVALCSVASTGHTIAYGIAMR